MKALAQEYKADGIRLSLLVGNPTKVLIAQNYVLTQVPEDNLFSMMIAGFWILEGLLIEHEVDSEKHPTLAKYLSESAEFSFPRKWKHYLETIQNEDLDTLKKAYESTRKSIYETMTDTPLEEKKS